MSSSFRRPRAGGGQDGGVAPQSSSGTSRSSVIVGLHGTKPWTGGITLTSVGLRELDAILGGGQPLGTCLLVEEDRWTRDLALCLIKYWCAEAISQNQTLLIPTTRQDDDDTQKLSSIPPSLGSDDDGISSTSAFPVGSTPAQVRSLLKSLPRNLHWDKATATAGSVAHQTERGRPLESLQEENEEGEEGLQIAWQYRKSIQDQRLGHATSRTETRSSDVYCHSYDLFGRLHDQRSVEDNDCIHIVNSGPCCENCSNKDGTDEYCRSSRQCGFRLYHQWLKHLQQKLKDSNQVVRLLLFQSPMEATSIALPLLLAYIRTKRLPVVVLLTIQPWTCPSTKTLLSLRRTSDVVLQTKGFASQAHYPPPPEFRHLHGLLLLPKLSTITAATANGGGHFCDRTMSKRPPALVYGLQRDRRKLQVPLLHIPPEDYADGGGSVGSGAVRSGAGRPRDQQERPPTMGCSTSGGGGGTSLLDF